MRYTTIKPRGSRTRGTWLPSGDDYSFVPNLEVDGEYQIDTGLVTEHGDPIYRLSNPIGFGRDSEW